jgi:hypothetical protein
VGAEDPEGGSHHEDGIAGRSVRGQSLLHSLDELVQVVQEAPVEWEFMNAYELQKTSSKARSWLIDTSWSICTVGKFLSRDQSMKEGDALWRPILKNFIMW